MAESGTHRLARATLGLIYEAAQRTPHASPPPSKEYLLSLSKREITRLAAIGETARLLKIAKNRARRSAETARLLKSAENRVRRSPDSGWVP